MITDQAMRDQVTAAVDGQDDAFDVPGIVGQIQQEHGAVDIHDVPHERFWEIVERHSII